MRIAMIVAVGLALLAAGCSADNPQAAPQPGPTERPYFERGEIPLSDEVEAWIDQVSNDEGAYLKRDGKYQHVVIAMGERMTGGYAVKVRDVSITADGCRIEVEFSEPKPGDMVTEAITYPYLFLSVECDGPVSVSVREAGTTRELEVRE